MKLLAVFAFFASLSAAQASIQSTGRTLTLGGISYFVPPSPVSALHDALALAVAKKSSGELIPFSVIPTSKTVFDQNALQATIDTWSAKDDVWSESFLAGMSSQACDQGLPSAHGTCRHLFLLQRHAPLA